MKDIIGLGPYIGSFEEEIYTFQPYMRWLYYNMPKDKKVYLSTHLNRSFLYKDFIDEKNIIPVYHHLTRDELNQIGYIHRSVIQKDYNIIVKNFKNEISERENLSTRNIKIFNIGYLKSKPYYPIDKKYYKSYEIDNLEINEPVNIVFIPSRNDSREKIDFIYNYLDDNYGCTVIGDMKTYLPEKNVILKNIDYIENGMKYIIKYITMAKAVICPISHWSIISNLQKKNLFCWGDHPGQFQKNGIYNFNNDKCISVFSCELSNLIRLMDQFLNNIDGII